MSINYKLYFGVVEDIFDPKKLGLVRVRIHDVHSPYEHLLKTKDLPWCRVLTPAAMSASISGIGHSNVSVLQGSLVAGFFIDESDKNEFIVLWSISGIPQKHKGKPKGKPMFKDPDEIFPLEYKIPDFNKLSREIVKKTPIYERDKSDNLVDKVVTSKINKSKDDCYDEYCDKSECKYRDCKSSDCSPSKECEIDKPHIWWEPQSRYNSKYPWNKVQQTISGHLFELDDTPDEERINLQHKSLSYLTFHKDGSIAIKDYKRRFDISKERRIYTDGDYYNTVKDNRYDVIRKKWKLYVKSFEITGGMKLFGSVGISGSLKVKSTVSANKGHFNIMEAPYSKTLAEASVCTYSICIKPPTPSAVSISIKGKVLIDTLSEAYELADLGVSNATKVQKLADKTNNDLLGFIDKSSNELSSNSLKLSNTELKDLENPSSDNKNVIKLVDGILKISTGEIWKSI